MGIAIANRKNRCDFGALSFVVNPGAREVQMVMERNRKKESPLAENITKTILRTFAWSSRMPYYSGVAPANQTKERSAHELFPGHSGTGVQREPCLFSQGKTPEFTKMGEIHELFVLALSLVWFAGATPELPMSPVIDLV